MNQDLPIQVDPIEGNGTITYATEVIATIVGVAAAEGEGISSMAGAATISELLSGRPKNIARGVRVEVGAEEVSVDVSVIVDYGMPIQTVGRNVQENIRKSIETMTGLHVIKVDVHVLGVSFEKENKELEQGQEVARLQSGQEGAFGGFLKDEAAEHPALGEQRVTLEAGEADAPPRKRGRPGRKGAAEAAPVEEADPEAEADPEEEADPAEEAAPVEASEGMEETEAEADAAPEETSEEIGGKPPRQGKKGKKGAASKAGPEA